MKTDKAGRGRPLTRLIFKLLRGGRRYDWRPGEASGNSVSHATSSKQHLAEEEPSHSLLKPGVNEPTLWRHQAQLHLSRVQEVQQLRGNTSTRFPLLQDGFECKRLLEFQN